MKKGQPSMICETAGRPRMLAYCKTAGAAILFQPRCKLWKCPACAQINKRLWTMRALSGASQLIEQGETINMLTLTSHGRLNAPETVWVFRHAWPALYKRARRAAGGLHYFMIPERHKDGRLHIHALSSANLGSRWWKDNGAQTGLGYMNEEEPCKDDKAAGLYVAKYIGKQLDGLNDWPKRFRRVRRSNNWPKMPPLARSKNWTFRVATTGRKAQDQLDFVGRQGLVPIFASHVQAWETIAAIDAVLA